MKMKKQGHVYKDHDKNCLVPLGKYTNKLKVELYAIEQSAEMIIG